MKGASTMSEHYIKRPAFTGKLKALVNKLNAVSQTNSDGNLVSPNTGAVIPEGTPVDGGHRNGFEFRHQRDFAEGIGMQQKEFNSLFGNPALYQTEPHAENISGRFEEHDHEQGMANVTTYAAFQDNNILKNLYVIQNDDSDTVCYLTDEEEMKELYTIPRTDASEDTIDYSHGCNADEIDFSDTNSSSENATAETDEDIYTH